MKNENSNLINQTLVYVSYLILFIFISYLIISIPLALSDNANAFNIINYIKINSIIQLFIVSIMLFILSKLYSKLSKLYSNLILNRNASLINLYIITSISIFILTILIDLITKNKIILTENKKEYLLLFFMITVSILSLINTILWLAVNIFIVLTVDKLNNSKKLYLFAIINIYLIPIIFNIYLFSWAVNYDFIRSHHINDIYEALNYFRFKFAYILGNTLWIIPFIFLGIFYHNISSRKYLT